MAIDKENDTILEDGCLSDERPFSIDELYGLSKGKLYRYCLNDEIFVEGQVKFNDDVTAIIKVTDRYSEGYFEIIYYKELRQVFPFFHDAEAQPLTEYLCLDVETESNLFYRDSDEGALMEQCYDEDGNYNPISLDPIHFRKERLKKKLIYELGKIAAEREEKNKNTTGPVVNVDLPQSSIDEALQDFGIDSVGDVLHYSLNRTIYWLNNRNCAILSAWRGEYSRTENDRRNNELQQSLRSLGYGIIRLKGYYAEIDKSIGKENSYLVFDPEDTEEFRDNIYEHSERYNQDCFLFKPVNKDCACLIGTNDDFGKGKVEEVGILRINSVTAENYSEVGSGRISFEKAKE